ncbi:putative MFS family arabinose efflux permease [Stackebrandtia albiflava]|uniref:Putative MFS family arabinose efflux permease n=1 Tax=Stackebrandtia albiflava TaxID=406432 RepID=A0A562V4E2_9ACTN|nr:MFS transporter [Stackebrandtia albiflava]TWJ12702.1 putative MFS family arabinose efflux permease [Stackebrandtia albiflava]
MPSSPPPTDGFRLSSVIPTVYLPAALFGVGSGAVAPVIVLSARDLGASIGVASLIVALTGIGQLIGDLPAGAFAAKVGERRAMLLAVVLIAATLVACIAATEVWMLGLAIGLLGLANAVWGIARHTYLTEVVPYRMRARAMSTLGGTHRIGMFIGPFVGAAAMQWWGTDGAYWVKLAAVIAAGTLVAVLPDPARGTASERGGSSVGETFHVLRTHLPVFRTLGLGAMTVGAVRASRQVVIPLWAEHVGADPTTTSIIFGIAGAVDMALFYPAGKAMDRFGRIWVAVPCMLVMAVSHLLIPLTTTPGWLLAAAILMGLGNGMGSGIIMTLGADASPAVGRPAFLGGWRLCADTGNAGGPVLISAVTAVTALAPAVLVMGGVGLLGAAALAKWIPRPDASPGQPVKRNRSSTSAAG